MPPEPSKVAFTVTLQPVDAAPPEESAAAVPKPAEEELPEPSPDAAPTGAGNSSAPLETSERPAAAPGGKPSDPLPEDWRKPADNGTPAPEAVSAGHLGASPAGVPESQPVVNSGPVGHAASPDAPASAAPSRTDPTPAPVPAAAAHDIKLQVGGEGEQRVEVRVTERGGEVFVAVRTPDGRLAGDLRQDLPALAARLEQSGFHATTWQPSAGAGNQRLADPSAGAPSQDAQSQSRQNGRDAQRDPQEEKPKGPDNPAGPAQTKEQGKDFAWLLSSIQ
jgi:hypothetical protein